MLVAQHSKAAGQTQIAAESVGVRSGSRAVVVTGFFVIIVIVLFLPLLLLLLLLLLLTLFLFISYFVYTSNAFRC